ncbi:MAG: hypothetical protein AAGC65_07805 [Mucilaginibacter sp.]|uniref:hypothetical protein n=1 Tax=Mucilaginibacter sp. TaxID=1882438 RepID=UPI0031B48DF6
MKTTIITLLSAFIFLSSCSNGQKTTETKSTDTVTTSDTIKKDTVKKDTVALKKSKSETEEERNMKMMNDIVKKRKTMK